MSCHVISCLAGGCTFHMKHIKKLCLLFSGSGSTLEVRKSILPFSSSLSVRKFFHFIFLTIRAHRLLLCGHLLVVVRLHQALHWTLGEVSMNSIFVPSSSHISHICSSGTVAATSCTLTAGTCRWTTVAHKSQLGSVLSSCLSSFSQCITYQTKLVSCSSKALLDM